MKTFLIYHDVKRLYTLIDHSLTLFAGTGLTCSVFFSFNKGSATRVRKNCTNGPVKNAKITVATPTIAPKEKPITTHDISVVIRAIGKGIFCLETLSMTNANESYGAIPSLGVI